MMGVAEAQNQSNEVHCILDCQRPFLQRWLCLKKPDGLVRPVSVNRDGQLAELETLFG
jgi:hypothetical protein